MKLFTEINQIGDQNELGSKVKEKHICEDINEE